MTRERIPRTCTGVDIWRNMWGQACGFDKITSQFIIVLEQKTIVLQNIGGGGHPDLRMLKTKNPQVSGIGFEAWALFYTSIGVSFLLGKSSYIDKRKSFFHKML